MKSNLLQRLPLLVAALAAFSSSASAAPAAYPVDRLSVVYGRPHPDAPPAEALAEVAVELRRDGAVLSAEGTGEAVTVRLGDAFPEGVEIAKSGLEKILAALIARLHRDGIYGAIAMPNRDQIDPGSMDDLRPSGERGLQIVVWLMEIAQVRTIAKGGRIPAEEAILNPKHARILEHSPLQAPASEDAAGDLFLKERLDEYLRRLNRHQGRVVEAALSSSDQPGRVVLDYLVNEERPWFVYGQFSNTGTEATDEFRERVGFVHNQLFGRDDVLSLDFITASLDKANAVFASYSIPLLFPDKLRARVFGSWGDFAATVDLAALSPEDPDVPPERFSGSSWVAGAELVWSPLTLWGASIDLAAGVSLPHYEVVNEATPTRPGKADLLTPCVSVRAERATEVFSWGASIGYEGNFKDVDPTQLTRLGRIRTQDTYDLIRAEVSASTYLEPLFLGLGKRDRWVGKAHAHEIAFQYRGQYVLGGERLVPQKEQAIGGFFTVRGYTESAVAGDNITLANLEYRFHLPRALRPSSEIDKDKVAGPKEPTPTLFGRPFRYRPPRAAARPDWDLILRAFVDYGRTEINRGTLTTLGPGERDYTLTSAGVGAEVQILRNLNARVDWGCVLEELRTGVGTGEDYLPGPNDTDKGDSRLHFLLTFVW